MYTGFTTIWDIDNCVSDDKWRQERIDWTLHGDDRYRVYNDAAIYDAAVHVREFEFMRRLGAKPVFFSGRPEYMRTDSGVWAQNRLRVDMGDHRLYLRPTGTKGISPRRIKEEMLLAFRLEFPDAKIIGAFDDIPAIVEMYRSYGIPAARLAINHDLSGAYEPADLI